MIHLPPPGKAFSSFITKLSAFWRHDSQSPPRNITSTPSLSNGMMPSSKSKKSQKIGTDLVSLSESSGKDLVVAKEGEFYEARRGSIDHQAIIVKWVFLECLFTVTVEAVKAK
ncbi:unnamed protein product [Brassica oleracea]